MALVHGRERGRRALAVGVGVGVSARVLAEEGGEEEGKLKGVWGWGWWLGVVGGIMVLGAGEQMALARFGAAALSMIAGCSFRFGFEEEVWDGVSRCSCVREYLRESLCMADGDIS